MAYAPEIQAVIMTVMNVILRDRALAFPWNQSWLCSKAEAEAASTCLPLVYSWNEVVSGGRLQSFSVSVNGSRLVEILVKHLPRSHPAFVSMRDDLIALLAKAQNRALIELCTEFQITPSRLSAQLKN